MGTKRAFPDLKTAGIQAQFLVANMVLSAEQASNPFLQRCRAMQQRHLVEAHHRFGLPLLILPNRDVEPKCLVALEELGGAMDRVKKQLNIVHPHTLKQEDQLIIGSSEFQGEVCSQVAVKFDP